jgi:hypothetical protein
LNEKFQRTSLSFIIKSAYLSTHNENYSALFRSTSHVGLDGWNERFGEG